MSRVMRGYHDIGGLDLGSMDRSQHKYAPWEKRADAVMVLLAGKGVITNDEHRHGVESLGAEAYERLTYYELWVAAMAHALALRGIITTDELDRRMAEVATRPADG